MVSTHRAYITNAACMIQAGHTYDSFLLFIRDIMMKKQDNDVAFSEFLTYMVARAMVGKIWTFTKRVVYIKCDIMGNVIPDRRWINI